MDLPSDADRPDTSWWAQSLDATRQAMGDGINDAPALHATDAGISVQGATDVAKETAERRPAFRGIRQPITGRSP